MAKKFLSPIQGATQSAAAEADRERRLYNGSTAEMKLLRQHGYTVVREGAGIRVDNSRCTFSEMKSKAARERRLLEAARPE